MILYSHYSCNYCYSYHQSYYWCLQNQRPLLMRPLLRVCPSPLAFGPRPDPSCSVKARKINTRSRHETPRDEIPARARGMYLGMCMAFSCARDGRLFCKHLYHPGRVLSIISAIAVVTNKLPPQVYETSTDGLKQSSLA